MRLTFIKMASTITKNLSEVLGRIEASYNKVADKQPRKPRLVAVSKTKPIEEIIEVYNAGHPTFGENYVQEIEEKGKNPTLLETCPNIRWHYIGRLQTNKVKKLLEIPNLDVVETVGSEKLANEINKQWAKLNKPEPIKVMVQVNTSGEDQKGGCDPELVVPLMRHMKEKCASLQVIGLMTIGAFNHDIGQGPNPDFLELLKCHETVCSDLGVDKTSLEISMGMSADFEHGIELGSTNVRVGSSIFGARNYPK